MHRSRNGHFLPAPGVRTDCLRTGGLVASAVARPREADQGKREMAEADITRLLALARDGEPAQMGTVFEAL
jgi:hypothetical protein